METATGERAAKPLVEEQDGQRHLDPSGCKARGVAGAIALQLARDGDSEPIHIEETDTAFAIGWKGRYRIEGAAFVYSDNDRSRVTTVLGYPTDHFAEIG
jgi:hypothetical protein